MSSACGKAVVSCIHFCECGGSGNERILQSLHRHARHCHRLSLRVELGFSTPFASAAALPLFVQHDYSRYIVIGACRRVQHYPWNVRPHCPLAIVASAWFSCSQLGAYTARRRLLICMAAIGSPPHQLIPQITHNSIMMRSTCNKVRSAQQPRPHVT